MTTLRKAAEKALEDYDYDNSSLDGRLELFDKMEALRAALYGETRNTLRRDLEKLEKQAVLTQELLKEHLYYDPLTGKWERLTGIYKGKKVGNIKASGYERIVVRGHFYQAHRLAWLYVTGMWPDGQIDHINGVRHDNRFSNLRDVPIAVNNQNFKVARKDSTSGVIGVSPEGSGWSARIRIDGKQTYLGTFTTIETASAAYLNAKRKHHEGCTI